MPLKNPEIVALSTINLLLLSQQQNNKKKANRKLWCRKWLLRRRERGISNLISNELLLEDPLSFKNFTRMSSKTFEDLLSKVNIKIQRKDTIFRECIETTTRLLVTLRFLATGETYQSLSYSFRISVPSLSIIIPETCEAIYTSLKDDYLTTPRHTEEWLTIANQFRKMWDFPMCLGALDGKHIAFRAKKSDGSFYYNYKGFHSIVLLALVDAEYNFVFVDVGCNGRVSDGGVYNNSRLRLAVDENLLNFPIEDFLPGTNVKAPYVLVADDAFKSTNRIIKPWGQRSSISQKIFNYRLSRARRVVENAFGILANRYQILQKNINLSVDKVQLITLTCCALHNYIKKKDGKKYLHGIDYENGLKETRIPGEWRKHVFMTNLERNKTNRTVDEAINTRNVFTRYFNGVGAVPWQNKAVQKFNF